MTRTSERAWVGAAALAVAASRFLLRARTVGSYDAIGFLRGIQHFDVARLQPHFPGYPVYVALARAARAFGLSPLDAATLISALMAGVTTLAVWRLGRALGGRAGGACATGLYAGAALPWLLGGAPLPESTAVAFGAWAFALLVDPERARPAAGAVCAALMLGARPDYAPLALSWLLVALFVVERDRAALRRAAILGPLAICAWLLPLTALVGPARLFALGRTHLAGHFEAWGGSIATRPGLGLRASAFVRDLFFDGLAPNPALLAALVTLILAALLWRARRGGWSRAGKVALLVAAPYALWVFFGQNVIEQPRHLLPLVVMLLVGLGALLGAQPAFAVTAIALVGLASAPLVRERVRSVPAALQAARYVEAHYPPDQVVVFGAKSIRFFEWAAPEVPTRTRTWLSEVDVDLERLDRLPPHVLVTDELTPDPARAARLGAPITFCRDPRLDRARPCLSLRPYQIGVAR
jgi:hypothetical protein